MTPTRPCLRYFGGKWALAPHIIPLLPLHETYTEAFAGAASILMRKPPAAREIITDLDNDIVTTFQVIRDHPAELARALRYTPYAESEYHVAFEPIGDPLEIARRTIVRSHQGIAAMDRRRCSGFRGYPHNRLRGNDTTCAHDWSGLPGEVMHWAGRLQQVQIMRRDATWALRRFDSTRTLHFVDPPYVIASRKMAQKRYSHEMNDSDHRDLAQLLHSLEGMVVLCGYPSPLYDELYGGWERIDIRFRGNTECLWRNPAATKATGLPILDAIAEVEGAA